MVTELYTAAQLVLFPFAALAVIIGAVLVAGAAISLVFGNAWRATIKLALATACTGAVWAYLMIPGGLG